MDAALIWPWILAWGAAIALPLTLHSSKVRRAGQVGLVGLGFAILVLQAGSPPPWRLLCASLLFLYLMKGAVLLGFSSEEVRKTSPLPYLLFFSIWPGMAIEGLRVRRAANSEEVQGFGRGLVFLVLGTALVILDALSLDRLQPIATAWLCVAGLLLAVHFGISEILTALVRLAGRPVSPLFDKPERSESLDDFWSRRWNLPFVEMGRRLFLRPIVRRLGPKTGLVAMFLISGLLHEMALSYPVGKGWGLPTLYFLIQATGVLIQKKLQVRSRLWTWAFILLPLPVLFHPAFLLELPYKFVVNLHGALNSHPLGWYLNIVLWILGVSQLLVLAASRQVPEKLNWKEELPRLGSFNRKLMWTYGAFVVFTILGFSAMTFALHDELLRGDRVAAVFALFAASYWLLRLGFDTFYFDHGDWPKGAEFVVGHALLNALFAFLVFGYGSFAAINLLKSI